MRMKKLINLVMVTTMALLVCSCGNNAGQTGGSKDNTETGTQTETAVEEDEYFSYQLLETHYFETFNYGFGDFVGDWVVHNVVFNGLVVCYGDSALPQYLMFDDEEDYYNDCIYEWTIALKVAKLLFEANIRHRFYVEDNLVLYQMNENRDTLVTFRHLYSGCSFNTRNDYAIDFNRDTIIHGDTISEFDYRYFENNKNSISELLNFIHCMPGCIDDCNNSEIAEIFKKNYYDLQDAGIYTPEKGYGYRKYPVDKSEYGYDYVTLYRIKEGEYKNVPGGVLGIKFESNSLW